MWRTVAKLGVDTYFPVQGLYGNCGSVLTEFHLNISLQYAGCILTHQNAIGTLMVDKAPEKVLNMTLCSACRCLIPSRQVPTAPLRAGYVRQGRTQTLQA